MLAALLVLGAVGYAAVRAMTPTYPVPGITGAELAASTKLPHGFKIRQHHLRRDGTQRGQLLGQSPAAGVKRPTGSTITVEVSDGQTLVAVPAVVGLSKADATARLQASGLVVATGDTPYSDTVAKDQVMDYSPKGQLEKGATVTLTISNGVRPIQLTDLSGMAYNNAKAILDGLGLPSIQNQVNNDTVPVGYVVSTSPGAGPVPPGTTITVNVSKGPQIVTVPDVTGGGMTVAQATAALQAVGLQVGNIYGPAKGQHVLDSQPGPGSKVPHGSSVDLFVGR
jgi:serine/threonine-protein kinase